MRPTRSAKLFSFLWIFICTGSLVFFLRAFPALHFPGIQFSSFGLKTAVARLVVQNYVPGICQSAKDDRQNTVSLSLASLCFSQWQPLMDYAAQLQVIVPSAESAFSDSLLADGTEKEQEGATSGSDLLSEGNSVQPEKDGAQASGPNEEPTAAGEDVPTAGEDALTAGSGAAVPPSGVSYSAAQLSDFSFLLNTFFTLDPTTVIDESLLNAEALLAKDLRLQEDNSQPQILIYHTHSQEEFADSTPGDPATSIIGVGDYLTKLLTEQYGYNVIHDREIYDMINGVLDRNKAYSLALEDVSRILEENPSVQIVIDLHRDGINGNKMTTMVNGKETAKFMFFNGLSRTAKNGEISYLYNPYIQDNLAFSLQMQLKAALYYPDVTRPIYLKCYRYNLHLRPRSLLVEAGSQKNTFQEELNAMDVLADILNKVLKGES